MSYGGGGYQMQVESSIVGRIIGRGGSKIRELETDSHTRIKISREEDENGMKTVEISGSDQDINIAKEMIERCLEQADFRGGQRGYGGGRMGGGGFGRRDDGGSWGRRDDGGGWGARDRDGGDGWGRRSNDYNRGSRYGDESESIYIDKGEVGRIIGRGGSKIRDLESNTGCKIKVSRDGSSPSEVVLEGSRKAISDAKRSIQDLGVEILGGPGDSGRGW